MFEKLIKPTNNCMVRSGDLGGQLFKTTVFLNVAVSVRLNFERVFFVEIGVIS